LTICTTLIHLVLWDFFREGDPGQKLENRFLGKTDVFLCLSEKEVSSLTFPNLEGRLDYFGFRIANESIIECTKALYVYYWEKGTSQIPEQLVKQINKPDSCASQA
jgi:hypothetical protein